LARFEFKSGIFQLFYLYLCFVCKIVFAYLVVCMWQVWQGVQ
jgi:hypothetical protein